MTFSPRAIEAAAAHVLRELDDRGLLKGVDDDLLAEIGNDVAKAALTAALAVDGLALVPRGDLSRVVEIARRNEASPEIDRLSAILAAASDREERRPPPKEKP